MGRVTVLDRVWMTIRDLFAGVPVSRSGLIVLVLAVVVVAVTCFFLVSGTKDKS